MPHTLQETLHVNSSGLKRRLINESSSMLWHKRLGHISRERLVSEGILNSLDFTDFKICVECVKGMNKHKEVRF